MFNQEHEHINSKLPIMAFVRILFTYKIKKKKSCNSLIILFTHKISECFGSWSLEELHFQSIPQVFLMKIWK